MKFFDQLRLLLWKMFIMKKRRALGTLCEIFLPVLLTSILIFVRDEVDITSEPMTYGQSIPVFSIFDVDGLPVSLPGTLDSQDICLGPKINKYIAVTPNNDNTRWFLSHLEEYYFYVSNQTLFDYYSPQYFLSNVDNFRDLFILINDTLDLCLDYTVSNITYECQSFIQTLNNTIGFDIYNDEQMEGVIAAIDISITETPQQIADFIQFLQEFELADLNRTVEFNVTDSDTIAELLEFTNSTTVCEFLDFMSEIGRGGDNTSNFTITLTNVITVFNLTEYNITCNDSAPVLLNAISEDLFNVTFDNVLNITDIKIYDSCFNYSALNISNNMPTSLPINNSNIIPSTTILPITTGFFTTRTRYFIDNDTYCLNETNIYDVIVNTQEFLTIVVDILTLQPNPTLNISDVTVGTIVELLNDSFIEDVIEDTLNITINATWIDDLYAIDYVDKDLTIGQIVQDFFELDLIIQTLRFMEGANNGIFNVSNINRIIDILFGNNTNFSIPDPNTFTPSPTVIGQTQLPTTAAENARNIFNNFTSIQDIINPNGEWNDEFINDLLEFLDDETGVSDQIDVLFNLLSTPTQPTCLNESTNNTFMDIFMFFDTVEEMEEYTQYRDYGDGKPAISAGIVFNHISNESIDYTLRFNQSDVHNTKGAKVDKYGRSPELLMANAFFDYIFSGFLGWQNAIDQTFLRILNYDRAISLKLGIHVFPFPPYENDYFWTVVKRLLPLLMVIAFSYPFVIIAKLIVDEKAGRLKEGFRILGGSNTAYLLSYIISYFVIFSISAAFLTWCMCANIFISSDPFLIFIGIELFGLVMTSLAMVVGMLFDAPRLGALVACLVFLIVFYVYRFIEDAPYEHTKNAICWSGPAAFALALLQVAEYEEYEIGAQWSNINELNELTNFRLSTAYYMMFIDFIIYTLFMFYLDRVWPTKYGVRRPWYAPFEIMDEWYDKIEWCRKKRGRGSENMSKSLNNSDALINDEINDSKTIEYVDEKITGSPMLELKQLTKIFKGGNEGRDNIAVDRLNLKMYQDQVFCLLGHNGAGKTTTCNMLTGMLSVSQGDAYMTDKTTGQRYSLVEHLPMMRQRTGLCPQHDILFPRMTVWEHLQFYGQVNGLRKGEELDDLCLDLLTKIHLKEKMQFQARMLSGGQKRKLSVCIALIGRTNLVILDEPTTGMDPFARRATWALIREYKKNRIIILTTHFMDEAEILADRIGIMVHGKLMCCGSSFYLKQQYDVGYALSLQLSTALNINQTLRRIDEVIREYVKDDSAKCIGQAATEILYRISFESNAYLPILFRYIDKHKKELGITKYAISATTLEEVFRTINDATLFSREESVSTKDRRDSSSNYNKYGDYKPVILNKNDEDSKISVDSDTNTTKNSINETHIETNDNVVPEEERSQLSKQSELESITIDGTTGTTDGRTGGTTQTELVGEDTETKPKHKRQASFLDGYDAVNEDETFKEYYKENYVNIGDRSCIPCLNLYFWRHVWLQIWKRTLNAKRDAKTFWCQCMIPSIFILWGLATTNVVWWEDQPEYYLDTQDWIMNPDISDGGILTIPYNAYDNSTRPSYYQSSSFEDLLLYDANNSYNKYKSYMTTAYQENTSLPEWQDILYNTRFDDIQPRYLSLYMSQFLDPDVLIIGANASAFHSIPIGLNLASDFIAQTISGNHSDPNFISNSYIKTASHPFPRTASQDVLIEAVEGFFTAITLAVGLIFVPGAYIALLVDERTNMVKHQQLVSGMDVISYWTGNFIFDTTTNIFPATLVLVYVALFDVELFLGEAAFATWFVVIMYGFAVVPFTYLASLFFSSPGTAQALTIFLYYSAAVIAMIAAWVMDLIPDDDLNNTNQTLKIIYRFFPPFCLSDSFRGISTRNIKLLWGKSMEPLAWEVTGRNLLIMFIESCGYFSLLLLLEYLSKSPAFLSWIGKINMIDDAYKGQYYKEENQLDDDVVKEQRKLKKQIGFNDNELLTDISESKDNDDEKKVEQNNINIIQYDNNNLGDDVIEPIEIHGLRKVYRGSYKRPPTVAVQDLWYTVKKGQVFGFLGMNGAGKTTTLSIISGVFPPSKGQAYINGYPISDQIAVRQSLGFCPQFSALFPRLTVIEHLEFFARIKGIENKIIRLKLANRLIKDLSLERYRNRIAGKLSGGNQRKLSVGIALIGNPPIVLLDEPTSGMDPVSKRSLWDFISATMSGRSVILTTHSMEECEALCDTIGIMINGQLACLGSNQHLKEKYGKGYQLDIKFDAKNVKMVDKIFEVLDEKDENKNNDIELDDMNNKDNIAHLDITTKELVNIFGEEYVKLMENYTNYARYQVGSDDMSIADVFEHLETIKIKCNILNYAVSQISLEQIFLGFAKEQKHEFDDKNQIEDDRGIATKLLAAIFGCFVIG